MAACLRGFATFAVYFSHILKTQIRSVLKILTTHKSPSFLATAASPTTVVEKSNLLKTTTTICSWFNFGGWATSALELSSRGEAAAVVVATRFASSQALHGEDLKETVIYNRETDQSRGFGFVTMSTVEEAEKAVEMFSGYEVNGRNLTVNKVAPRGSRVERSPQSFERSFRIYVGNLPWQVDDARLD
ncbi:hypothetical protein QQ045_015679 [Rhodiola kirilowii]